MKRFRLFAILLCIWPIVAYAQNADVSGVVQDSSGAIVPKVTVEFRNQNTGIRQRATTNENGYYHIAAIQPGKYDATVQAQSFQTLTQEGILLQTDTAKRIDFTLRVGTSKEIVVVTANGLLQQNDDQMETHITEEEYENLPLLQMGRNRNPATFMYLAPGVEGDIALNSAEYTGATNAINPNGGQIYTTEILVEGLPGGQSRIAGNFTESSPPPDAISEFKVTTTGLPAEYGHTGGTVGSFRIKSGTNDWHGSAYEYLRNSVLDANNWLAKYNKTKISSVKQNEFGATIGGPVIIPHLYDGHDRTFFFFSYGGSRYSGPTSYTQVQIPTMDQRQGLFTFTGPPSSNAGLYDPATTNLSGASYARNKFPVALTTATTTTYQIPTSRFDPVAQNVLKYYPAPNLPGTNNYGGWGGNPLLNSDLFTSKVDHLLTPNQHLSAVYIRTKIPRTTIGGLLVGPLASNSSQVVASHTGRLNHTWTVSPSLVNAASFGFNRFTNSSLPLYQSSGYPQEIGFNTPGYYFPTFTFTNGFTTVASVVNSYLVENDFYSKDQMIWQHRNHTFTFGGEWRKMLYNDTSPYKTAGTYGFNSLETGNPTSQSGTGNAFASFLLGQVDTGSINMPVTVAARKSYWVFFVQDDYHVNKRLTLNMGLRYEWQPPAIEAHDHMSAISLTASNPGAGNRPGALVFAGPKPLGIGGRHLFDGDQTSIGPRFSFAFSAAPGTVLRGAYGVYYSDPYYNGYTAVIASGYQVTGTFSSPNNGVSPAFTLASGVPQTYPTTPSPVPTFINGQAGSYYGAHVAAMPRLQDWNFNIQQQLSKNSAIVFAYLGQHGTRQNNVNMVNVNQVDPKYLSLGSLLTQPATSSAAANAGIISPYPGFSGSVAQALRPYPQYLTLTSVAAKVGSSRYNAAQVIYQTRTTWGLTFNANYVFSKNMGYGSLNTNGFGGVNNILQNAAEPSAEWSLLPMDVRHSFKMYYSYALPFGPGRRYLTHGFASKLAGGWMISATQNYKSGPPILVYMTNNLPIFNSTLRPDVVSVTSRSLHMSNGQCSPTINCIFNKAAFATPAPYTFGNARTSYSDVRNFPILSENASIVKETKLGEHVQWSLYGQAVNLFNRHRFINFTSNYSLSTFGVPGATSAARAIQIGTRIRY